MNARVRHIDAGGVSLCVESIGRGTPVLMLHGFTGDAESMAPAASALGEGFEVHRVELVGHGRSDAPTDVGHYSMPRCTRQLARVLDALGLQSTHVYGYSMGGRVALSWAAEFPARVRSLVLVGATAGFESLADREDRIAADEALARRILARGLESFVDEWMALPIFSSQKRLGEEALGRARAQRLRGTAQGFAQSLRGMGTGAMPPLHSALPHLDVPTLLVVGDEDEKFAAIASSLSSALPRARTSSIPQAGHAAHLENPEVVGRVVSEFIRSVDASWPRIASDSSSEDASA